MDGDTHPSRDEMERRIEAYARDLSLLNEASRAMLFGMGVQETAEYLCGLAVERLGYKIAWIGLADDAATIVPVAARGAPSGFGDEPAGEAFRTARAVVARDVHGLGAAAALPLISGDRVLGVMNVYDDRPSGLDPDRVSLLQSLANLAASAVSAARANEELKRRAANLEVAVVHRTAELRSAIEELQSFTYSVSHDLRAPLRAISGFAGIVLRRYRLELHAEAAKYLDNIVHASAHMGRLIDDLLDYARLGRRGVEAEAVHVDDVLAAVMEDLGDRVAKSGGRVEMPPCGVVVRGDATLLRQVLTNLTENALTYHSPGEPPDVRVSCEQTDGAAIIRVSDRGIGIAPEHRQAIFNIFQRLHSAEQYPGTGIGLAIVKKCVSLLGGSVWVESTPGQGSTFAIKLPAANR